jgi:hypothetical protein
MYACRQSDVKIQSSKVTADRKEVTIYKHVETAFKKCHVPSRMWYLTASNRALLEELVAFISYSQDSSASLWP